MPGVSRKSNFSRWAREQNCFGAKAADSTHLLLSGGILKITNEDDALAVLALDIDQGNPNYVVEMRTPVFRMCQDYDFVTPDPAGVSLATLIGYMETVQAVLREIFPELGQEAFTAIVCCAPLKLQEKDVVVDRFDQLETVNFFKSSTTERRSLTKSGFHAVWPNLFVDRPNAIRIRFILRQALRNRFPGAGEFINYETKERLRFDSWDNILDLTIYLKNGLRILGSSKATKCRQCRKKTTTDNGGCDECMADGRRTGYVDEGRPYAISCVLDGSGQVMQHETQQLKVDAFQALKQTSIRCTRGETVSGPLKIPRWFRDDAEVQRELDNLSGKKRNRPQAGDGRVQWNMADTRNPLRSADWGAPGERQVVQIGNRNYDFEVVAPADQRAQFFESFLNDSVLHGAERLFLRRIMISTDVARPYIFAVGSTKFCINVGREHSGQDVYYMFNGQQVEQRCWSSKEGNDRKFGPCTEPRAIEFFRKKGVKLPTNVFKAIFPRSIPRGGRASIFQRPTPPPIDTTVDLSRATAPGNRHPQCSPMLCQWQLLSEQYRRDILSYPGMLGKIRSFGKTSDDEESDEHVAVEEDVEITYANPAHARTIMDYMPRAAITLPDDDAAADADDADDGGAMGRCIPHVDDEDELAF